MPSTKIEAFLFKEENHAHLVTGYEFEDQSLRITFVPFEQPETMQGPFDAVFPEAVITSMEENAATEMASCCHRFRRLFHWGQMAIRS
jgi:hypothetical protein